MKPEREIPAGDTVGKSPAHSSDIQTGVGWRSLVVTAGVSCLITVTVWFWPIQPLWISAPVAGRTSPIGFTADGSLISIEAADSPHEAAVRLRNASTGVVVGGWKVGQAVENWGELTPDGRWVILRTPPGPTGTGGWLIVDSVQDGSPRCPPIPVLYVNPSPMSADGRYKMIYTAIAKPGDQKDVHIVDLSTGQLLYPTGRHVAFSPDSRIWASLETIEDTRFVVFCSLADGKELGRSEVTAFPDARRARPGKWQGDRLEIEFNHEVADNDYSRETWSYQVTGTQLGDMRVERALVGEVRDRGDFVPQTWWESGPGWAVRYRQSVRSQSMFEYVSHWVSVKFFKGVPVSRSVGLKTTWQRVSPSTGWAITRPIEVNGIHCVESPDGVWLAEGGDRLRVWRVRPMVRTGWAFAAALLPWFWRILRRRRAGLARSTPVQ